MAAELERGVPSHVTEDFAAEIDRADARRAARTDERQPLSLRRLQRHRRRDHRAVRDDGVGGRVMTPFTYARASDAADAIRLVSQPHADGSKAKFLGGGTNLVDLMRETIERPAALVDVTGLSSAIDEHARRRPDDRRRREEHRGRRASRGPHALPDAVARDRRRRVGADPQHGHRRRQPVAANPLHVLLRRRRLPLQQAFAGPGLRCDRRLQPHPRDPRRVIGLRRDASVRHVRRARGAGRDRARAGAERHAHAAADEPASPAVRPSGNGDDARGR